MKYSIVVPAYNEASNVAALHEGIVHAMVGVGASYEIIIVNDGSTDATRERLNELSPITVIDFPRNFGQTAALDAGIKQATGEFIITLDADLQNPPSEIPKLIAEMERTNADVVSGWRKKRNDPSAKHIVSRGANMLRKLFINDGIHDSGCTLKLYRRHCFNQVDLFGEMHRFIPGVLRWRGFTIVEVEVEHKPRVNGQSKYSSSRILKGLVDMIGVWFWQKYSSRPLHLFGGGGIILTLVGIILLGALAVARIVFAFPLSESIWPLIAVFCILIGIQLFISGLLAEILIKQYYKGDRKPYTIKSITTR